jgi:uncharacterized lipoprotein YmbA
MHRFFPILALAAFIGACASNIDVEYFTLSPTSRTLPAGEEPVLAIGPVTVPDYLLRSDIALRQDANRLSYLAGKRWAEPLDSAVQRVLGDNLGNRLGTNRVNPFPGLAGAGEGYRVILTLRRFEAVGDRVAASIDWKILAAADGARVASGSFEEQADIGTPEAGAIAAGLSQLLDRLAARLATAIEAAPD